MESKQANVLLFLDILDMECTRKEANFLPKVKS